MTRRSLGRGAAMVTVATLLASPVRAMERAVAQASFVSVDQDPGGDGGAPQANQARRQGPPPGRRGGQPPPQARPGQPPNPNDGLSAAQVERLFDEFVLERARAMLQLGPQQTVAFGNRFRALQDVKRRGQRRRQQLLNELNQLSRGAEPADDATLAGKLKALDEVSAQGDQEVRDAYARLDEILNVRQRVGFRVLEQNMERRKLDLLAQARNAARGDGSSAAGPAPAQTAP